MGNIVISLSPLSLSLTFTLTHRSITGIYSLLLSITLWWSCWQTWQVSSLPLCNSSDINHNLLILPRSKDFYHTCYCLSGLSVSQHCFGEEKVINITGDSNNELVSIVVASKLKLVSTVDKRESDMTCDVFSKLIHNLIVNSLRSNMLTFLGLCSLLFVLNLCFLSTNMDSSVLTVQQFYVIVKISYKITF